MLGWNAASGLDQVGCLVGEPFPHGVLRPLKAIGQDAGVGEGDLTGLDGCGQSRDVFQGVRQIHLGLGRGVTFSRGAGSPGGEGAFSTEID